MQHFANLITGISWPKTLVRRDFTLLSFVCLAASLLTSAFQVEAATASPTPSRVLVVYNANWAGDGDNDGVQDSLQVANYYISKRGIPAGNVLGLACSTGGDTGYGSYTSFYNEVAAPIKTKLSALGATNIDVIVFCYGVPYLLPAGTSLDNAVMSVNFLSATSDNTGWYNNSYLALNPTFSPDIGHFDHASFKDPGGNDMYLVSRLDGPRGVLGVLEMIDQALYGERYISAQAGYYNGNVYVDSKYGQDSGAVYTDAFLSADSDVQSGNYYSYGAADKNMAYAEHYVPPTGFPLKWENTNGAQTCIGDPGATFSDGTPAQFAPKALFYGGWYNYGKYNDVWSWLPGSVACDLNSNSLDSRDLRIPGYTTAFGVSALLNGACCVSGVVNEPYLTGHQRPNVLLYYILKGYSFAEASTLATPNTGGWMEINIGDPLYAPLKAKSLVKDTQPPAIVAGYPQDAPGNVPTEHTISLVVSDSPEPEVAQVKIEYGLSSNYGSTVFSGEGFWRRHTLLLSNLTPNAIYHYRVTLTDPVGNVSTTGDLTFSTAVRLLGGFETPSVGPAGQSSSYQYNPTGSPWTFTGQSGISGNGSVFTQYNSNAPEGVQVAFLQNHGSFSQAIGGFEDGASYTFVFSAAQRGYSFTQDFQVWLDSTLIGHFVPSGDYTSMRTASIAPGAGTHTLTFVGLNTPAQFDVTALIDNVMMFSTGVSQLTSPVVISQPSSVTVAAGQSATFSIAASGSAPLSYQWMKNGAPISQATGASYTTPPASSADDGASFSCTVSNGAGSATSSAATLTVTSATETPYGGTAWPIPGTIQAEDFDNGGEGIAYHDSDAGNNGGAYRATDVDIRGCSDSGGGYQVGWTSPGEWLNYTVNVVVSGSYTFNARSAAGGSGGAIHLEMDGTNISGTLGIPNTGSYDTWQDVTATVNLAAGPHIMRIAIESPGFDLNYFQFTVANQPPVLTSAATAAPNPAQIGQAVTFTAAASDGDGDTLSYAWDFGDGAIAGGSSVTHAYTATGTYNATVMISDGRGGNINSSVFVTITSAAASVTLNDTDASIVYSGGWSYSSGRGLGDYFDDVHYVTSDGEYFQYTFNGTGIDLVSETYTDEGNVDIYLDGNFQTTANCYSAQRLLQQTVYSNQSLTPGSHTIKMVKSGGQYALLDALRIYGSSGMTLRQGGFETPQVGLANQYGSFQYNPSGSAWTFAGQSGISANGSGFTSGNPDAPEGAQVAFLQGTGTFSQTIEGFQADVSYTVLFSTARRGIYSGTQDFQVFLDGTLLGTYAPQSTSYSDVTTATVVPGAGSHTLKFVGLNSAGGDNSAFIDNVRIVTSNSVNSTATIVITCDNAYDLYFNGTLQGSFADWTQSQSYSVSLVNGPNVVAVKCTNFGGPAALLAEIQENAQRLGTDTTWKVSATEFNGWETVGFDDSAWPAATDYGNFGAAPWYQNVSSFPADSAARWIWSNNVASANTVYVRFNFTPSALAPSVTQTGAPSVAPNASGIDTTISTPTSKQQTIDLGFVKLKKVFKLNLSLPGVGSGAKLRSSAKALPPGVRVAGGTIGGRPGKTGAFSFTVLSQFRTFSAQATGKRTATTGQISQNYSITVVP